LGRAPEPLVGIDFNTLVHRDDSGKLQRFLASCAFSAGMTYTVELRVQRGDGLWATVEILGDNRTQDHAIGGIVITLRDLSDTRAIQVAEAEAERDTPVRTIH
jgi:PAS domain S-box-containing protein